MLGLVPQSVDGSQITVMFSPGVRRSFLASVRLSDAGRSYDGRIVASYTGRSYSGRIPESYKIGVSWWRVRE